MAINEQLFVKIGQVSKNVKVAQQEDPLLSQEIESLKLKIDCLEQQKLNDEKYYKQQIDDF